MKSYDYYAVAYDGAVYCTEHLPTGVNENSLEVTPVFADSAWDFYPTCDRCHKIHDYVCLIADGRKYEAEQARRVKARAKQARKSK